MDKKYPGKRLSVMFSLLTLITLTLTLLFTGAFAWLLIRVGLLVERNRSLMFFIIAAVSVLVGTVISHFAGRHPLSAIIAISSATQEVAKGNFSITLDENIEIKELRDMAHNFNRMAKELAGTEMLRTDFVEMCPMSSKHRYPPLRDMPLCCKSQGCPRKNGESILQRFCITPSVFLR